MQFSQLLEIIENGDFSEEYLELGDYYLEDSEIIRLVKALKSSPNAITDINLTNNRITDLGAKSLATLTLRALYLCQNKIGCEGCIALSKNNNLKKLDLGENNLNDECIQAFENNHTLEELYLPENHITPIGVQSLTKMNLRILKIDSNPIGDDGVRCLAEQVSNISELSLSHCDISDAGASALATMVSLKVLCLYGNQISRQGAIALSAHKALISLNLNCNKIDDEGARSLANIPSLMKLDLSYNEIKRPSDLSVLFRYKALQLPDYLEDLNFSTPELLFVRGVASGNGL